MGKLSGLDCVLGVHVNTISVGYSRVLTVHNWLSRKRSREQSSCVVFSRRCVDPEADESIKGADKLDVMRAVSESKISVKNGSGREKRVKSRLGGSGIDGGELLTRKRV